MKFPKERAQGKNRTGGWASTKALVWQQSKQPRQETDTKGGRQNAGRRGWEFLPRGIKNDEGWEPSVELLVSETASMQIPFAAVNPDPVPWRLFLRNRLKTQENISFCKIGSWKLNIGIRILYEWQFKANTYFFVMFVFLYLSWDRKEYKNTATINKH